MPTFRSGPVLRILEARAGLQRIEVDLGSGPERAYVLTELTGAVEVGERVVVEIHAGCGRCDRCRQGMYTSCWNYGRNYGPFNKGHRANGFTSDGGFAQYAVNHTNTLHRVPSTVGDELATMIVTAGTAM